MSKITLTQDVYAPVELDVDRIQSILYRIAQTEGSGADWVREIEEKINNHDGLKLEGFDHVSNGALLVVALRMIHEMDKRPPGQVLESLL